MISVLSTHKPTHTYTHYPVSQQDKPALVVPGLFDFWDEMSEQSTLRHYRTGVCVCKRTHARTPASACLYACVPSLLLHTKETILISQKSWNSSTVAEEQQNQRRQFYWRMREKRRKKREKKGRQRDTGKQGRGQERERVRERKRSIKKL